MLLEYYKNILGINETPSFLEKYLLDPRLLRLQKIGYFCGMDYASNDIYDFREVITRYDHSLTVALLTYKLTKNKEATLAALYHDIATPCFSHVIDYMNKDYNTQSSTEEYTEYIMRDDLYLQECLKEDNIDIDDIIDFKKYTIVDNERPKLCADRLDGIILTAISWTKSIDETAIKNIIEDVIIYKNENKEYEIGFKTKEIAYEVLKQANLINVYCHSDADNYMMELLADITKNLIDLSVITYEDLYDYNEEQLFEILYNIREKNYKSKEEEKLSQLITLFENIKESQVTKTRLDDVKNRNIEPIGQGKRVK